MPFFRDLVSVPSSHDVSEDASPALEKNSLDLTARQVQAIAKPRRFPSWKQWRHLSRVLNKTERLWCVIAVGLLWFGVLWIAGWYLLTHRVDVPTVGGEYVEGLVGQPQYINPLYASASDVDADLASLIFSGLLKWDPEDGLVPDLADSITISEDGKIYTVTLRENAIFHNGDPVEARDVLFTVNAIQDATYRSPLAVSFSGVMVTQNDARTIVFTLQEPFAPFLSALTVGILPANVWGSIPSAHVGLASYNLEAIGSGPYRFLEFSKDKTGAIRSYTLERFEDYYGQKALIERLTFKFYEDTTSALNAFDNRQVEGLGYISFDEQEELEKRRELTIFYPTIRREIALFFNQNAHAALKSSDLRQALAQSVDKQAVLDQAARGKGTVIHTPLLPGMTGFHEGIIDIFNVESANLLLDKTFSWSDDHRYRTDPNIKQETKGEDDEQEETQETSSTAEMTEPVSNALHFTLTTVASGEYIRAAQWLAEQWKTLGVDLEIKTVAAEDFYSQVLEPKNYQILLTGVLLGVDADPYPFWHSSQMRQGGLNLAGYNNKKVDTLLEEARTTTDTQVRAEKYRAFQEQLHEDTPAVFLYQSAYGYALPNKIKGVSIPSVIFPSDRFANIADWYIKTKKSLR
jgi:peptide/nickel transport system substrate-binding protein